MFMVGAMLSKHIDEYLTLFSDLKGVIPIFFPSCKSVKRTEKLKINYFFPAV